MSYDLRIGVKVDGTDIIAVVTEPEYNSPTYNVGDMIRACTGWYFRQGEWYRVTEVWPLIEHGITELRVNRGAYRKYEPENGWGSVSTALTALESLSECISEIAHEGYGWNQIPAEHLWVCW